MESPENRSNRNLAISPHGMSVAISWQKNDLGGFRNPRSQTQVRAPLIVVSDPLRQDPAQLFLTQWNYEIQAFAFGACADVRNTFSPNGLSCSSTAIEKIESRSRMRKR